jgi:hypothetical protein
LYNTTHFAPAAIGCFLESCKRAGLGEWHTIAGRQQMTKDYYELLGVDKAASYDAIKLAWRDKAKQWHPDKFQSDLEKLAAHNQFVAILEAYSVLIDAQKRAVYDRNSAAGSATSSYTGYDKANADQDQQEVSDWFQRILNETPSEFAKTTGLILIFLTVTPFLWMGTAAIAYIIYQIVTGQSPLGWGGSVMTIVLFFPNLLLSVFSALMIKDLYYRVKRIWMWIAMRARIKRVFGNIFGRKPGRNLAKR